MSSQARWTEAEKLALCMALLRQNNIKPNWNTLELPEGRSIKAAQFCFHSLKKEASKTKMVSASDVTPTKKLAVPRTPKKVKVEKSNGDQNNGEERGKKRKAGERSGVSRKTKDAEIIDLDDDDDNEMEEDSNPVEVNHSQSSPLSRESIIKREPVRQVTPEDEEVGDYD